MIQHLLTLYGPGPSGWVVRCAVFGCVACSTSEEGMDKPLARAYDQVLSWSDLRQVVPLDASVADSTALAEQYIEGWLKQQVVLHMAEQNQMAEGLDMEAQLEDYRRSLVIFNYEQMLVEQKLDTAVQRSEIEKYYSEHQSNFELKGTIVRMRWFKVNESDKRLLRKMEGHFVRGTMDDLHELEIWLARRGVSIVDRSLDWVPASSALDDLGLRGMDDAEALLQRGRRVVRVEDSAWFIDVIELRSQNSISPLEMVRADIQAILLNQRKIQLIEDMRSTIYAQALGNKDVERFAP